MAPVSLSPASPLSDPVFPLGQDHVAELLASYNSHRNLPTDIHEIAAHGKLSHDVKKEHESHLHEVSRVHGVAKGHADRIMTDITKQDLSQDFIKFCNEAEVSYPKFWAAIQSKDSQTAQKISQDLSAKLNRLSTKAYTIAESFDEAHGHATHGIDCYHTGLNDAHHTVKGLPHKEHLHKYVGLFEPVKQSFLSVQSGLDLTAKNLTAAASQAGKAEVTYIVAEKSPDELAAAWRALSARAKVAHQVLENHTRHL